MSGRGRLYSVSPRAPASRARPRSPTASGESPLTPPPLLTRMHAASSCSRWVHQHQEEREGARRMPSRRREEEEEAPRRRGGSKKTKMQHPIYFWNIRIQHFATYILRLGMKTDENGRKNNISTFVSIFFWRKRERVQKIRVRKRNRNMRTYENGQIRMECRKIKLRSHNLIFSKFTYIKSCNNIYKV
jgi:hypothetical protein